MSIWLRLCVFLPGVVILSLMMRPFPAHAQCRVEAHTHTRDAFIKHLSKTCTDDERHTHAVHADELFLAVQQGQAVDLVGVVIVGDLFLDRLPWRSVPLSEQLPALTEELLESRGVKNVRVISQLVSIRDSRVNGVIATKLKDGYLLIQGPVTMTGTTFANRVDLSRTIFSEDVNFSDAVFQREGFFLQTVFNRPARFERAVFGVHTRFHRARFGETVTFERAQFNGLAEFLEVTFDKDANLSRSSFKMGTGFSGAQFTGHVDFSEARFERDVYFLFTHFTGDGHFSRATFRGQADFSDAEFLGMDDFSHVSFTVDPVFQRTKVSGPFPTRESLYNFKALYGIAATFLVLTMLLIWIRRR
jgi:Pentapeptide repeats (9 copies)